MKKKKPKVSLRTFLPRALQFVVVQKKEKLKKKFFFFFHFWLSIKSVPLVLKQNYYSRVEYHFNNVNVYFLLNFP